MKFYIVLVLTMSTVFGCKTNTDEKGDYAYFGGEIINPNNDYVVLYNLDDKADTLFLDKQNRFILKIKPMKAGLYTFKHGGENQRILLEPQDSIMLRLNTLDFDESLVFTGKGARKNNYLIKVFLENESDNQKFMRLCLKEPKKFQYALDSIRKEKQNNLVEFLDQNELSDLFQSIAKANIDYNYYQNMELYPFGYFGYSNLIHHKDLPDGFYAFRKNVDYNNEELIKLIPYSKFLFYHFNNIALDRYYKTATHNVVFDNKSVVYNLEKLRLMDSLISNETIKNNLLKYTTRDFISVSKDSSETREVLNSFFEKSTNDKDKSYINEMVKSLNSLKPGNIIPSIKLVDYKAKEMELTNLISRPTVIYFWSSSLPALFRNAHYKVKILKQKYPDIDFIAININDDDPASWKKTLQQFNFDTTSEYQFVNPNEAMIRLAINSANKSIVVDKDLKIVNSNAFLFSSELEDQLQQLLNKKEAQ